MSSRPPLRSTAPAPQLTSKVARARRSCIRPSCDSSASSAGAFRFMGRRRKSETYEQSAVACHVGVAGGEQLLAVEDGVGAGEEAQRLQLVAHRLAPRRQTHL